MATSIFFCNPFKFTYPTMVLLTFFSTALFFILIIIFLKYAIWRRKYNLLLPGIELSNFNLLGDVAFLPFRTCLRSGYPSNVSIPQAAGGYYQLFPKMKLICCWLSYVPIVVLLKAEAVEELMSGTKHIEKSWLYNFLHPWLNTGLLTSHGSKWKSRRKLLTPSFHFEILKDFLPVFNEQAKVLVKILKKETDKAFTDIRLPVKLCSLDIIAETTLGVHIGAQSDCESKYVKAVTRVSHAIMERVYQFWFWPDFIFGLTEKGRTFERDLNLLHSFTRSVIRDKKEQILNKKIEINKSKRKALMDLLLEHNINSKTMSEEDVREEIDTFVFEGHDTTATGICWALYLIGLYKDVQRKVHEEQDRIFGDDTDRHVCTEDLKEMKYLDKVLKESQRLYPSVPVIGRQLYEKETICGYSLPKGTTCIVVTYGLHRDPEVFPNPENFDPDRFSPENSLNRSPYAYIPFSAGPRNCIGQRFALMELKTVISTILRHFEILSLDERDKLPAAASLILGSPNPIRIKFRQKEQN